MAENRPIGTVLVAGAGISGIKAAIELAETGYKVLLTDDSPHMGGILAKLDYQFPTDHCGMCRMLPLVGREYASQYCMRKSLFHENIEILPFTEITSVQGNAGDYRVELLKRARSIDPSLCNEMGECLDVCPVEVDDELNHRLTRRKAIYQPVPHNTPKMLLIDREACTRCGECLKVCATGAINLDAKDETETREVHSIILASGVKLYNTREFDDVKSYAVSPDVVSSLAFERMMSGSGTYRGDAIRRPSDGRPARNIAWVQCMGSRNRRQGRDYCSSICCMFALKEAVLAKAYGGPDVDTTIFYMDMRTFGKGFQQYRDRAVEEHGVNLVRCRVQGVTLQPDGGLQIRYFDPETNEFSVKDYDLVVLSTGQIPFETHRKWADLLSAPLDSRGLLATEPGSKVRMAGSPGLFLCGSLMGLTDVSEAMTSGIAAAGEATKFLTALGVDTLREEEIPDPPPRERETPLVSVAVCRCGEKAGAEGVDYGLLASELQRISGVGDVQVIDSICQTDGETAVADLLGKTSGNRLLVGACQPFMYRQKLKNVARRAGFSSSMVEIFDLLGIARKGSAEPSVGDWTLRTARDVRADIERLRYKPALRVSTLPITQAALVVGGGIAGMQAALSLAGRGVQVHLVEKGPHLGGYLGSQVEHTVDGLAPVAMATDMKLKVFENRSITVHLRCEVEKTVGTLGSFESKLHSKDTGESTYVHHGAVILATGGREGATTEYGYGASDTVLTQAELKQGLASGGIDANGLENVVMIQCVGSRQKDGRPYCSRICCMGAIGNALKIKELSPDARVFILYRDVMTYGFYEQYYSRARSAGIVFMSYGLDEKPRLEMVEGKPVVHFRDPVLNLEMELPADLVALSTGVDPEESSQRLAEALGVSLTEDGFLAEADSKWRPVEFQKVGFYLAGTAHSPMPLRSVILQAEAAAQKAYTYLSGREVHTAAVTSTVRDALCVRCQRCVSICPYGARAYNDVNRCIDIDAAACQACGQCAVECQNNAAEVRGWTDRQLMAVIDAQLMDSLLSSTVA
ncbi:MAG: FAD-dependent oxidoreductase [Syntrophobacteraceae bacterium]|jgi:heterodisulfide reductase subunit A|nr:FAD-dependent oxidoreductase [Syntrophobacteraceae bacterium]